VEIESPGSRASKGGTRVFAGTLPWTKCECSANRLGSFAGGCISCAELGVDRWSDVGISPSPALDAYPRHVNPPVLHRLQIGWVLSHFFRLNV
jgi:hypothetical protein